MESWKYCKKCGKAITFKHGDAMPKEEAFREVNRLMIEHQRHLCFECKHNFATCKGQPVFGECFGIDNVVDCDRYQKK